MAELQFIVPCLFGLEGLAGDELRRLNMENVRVEDRRVLFTGDAAAMAKANICPLEKDAALRCSWPSETS